LRLIRALIIIGVLLRLWLMCKLTQTMHQPFRYMKSQCQDLKTQIAQHH
jgi:hypothetical protein